MNNKYLTYQVEDLILDDYFIDSVLHPTSSSKEFWQGLCSGNLEFQEKYRTAKLYILSCKAKKEQMDEVELLALFRKVQMEISKTYPPVVRRINFRRVWYGVAACFALLLAVGSVYYATKKPENTLFEKAIADMPVSFGEQIELILSETEKIEITEKTAVISYNTTTEKNEVKVNTEVVAQTTAPEKKEEEPVYNQLIVPAGKQSNLLLSDGTHLYVNAGTRVVYPSTFGTKKREIYIEGEAYLEVIKDVTRPFIVKTPQSQIQVLGTSFNVTAYKEDKIHSVVLVEGAVQVEGIEGNKGSKICKLSPNEMYVHQEGNVPVVKEVDVSFYTSWKDGVYKFRKENLEYILTRLSRYYGVPVKATRGSESLLCTGKLELKDDLERVLNGLTITAPVAYTKTEEGEYHFYCEN